MKIVHPLYQDHVVVSMLIFDKTTQTGELIRSGNGIIAAWIRTAADLSRLVKADDGVYCPPLVVHRYNEGRLAFTETTEF